MNVISENKFRPTALSPIARWLGVLAIATVWLTYNSVAFAEFYPRNDHLGRKHLSNLPPHSFGHNGEIRPAYDPNSIVYQHAKMREALAEQSAAIVQAQEQEARETEPSATALEAPTVRHLLKEGNMNLDELIALEKRGGQWQADDEGRP